MTRALLSAILLALLVALAHAAAYRACLGTGWAGREEQESCKYHPEQYEE